MAEADNRRQFERRPLAEKLFGYLDGQRFDVASANVSEGGLFLRVDDPARVPLGARLALVFRREAALRDRIFLVAHVVRHQAEPAGLGLRWVKALAGGNPLDLARFLELLLGLPRDATLPRIQPEAGGTRVVYRFPSAPEVRVDVLPPDVTARGVVETMPRLEPPPPPPDAGLPEVAGPVTQQIAVDAIRAPTRLPAALRTASKTQRVTIVALGARGLIAHLESIATGPFDRLEVAFTVPAGGLELPVNCVARLTAIEPLTTGGAVSLDLELTSLDEGANPGVVRQYVRWLHHRAMTSG